MNRYILWCISLIVLTGAAISFLFTQSFQEQLLPVLEKGVTLTQISEQDSESLQDETVPVKQPYTRAKSLSGSYLAGRFAQRHYDWKTASGFIGQILATNQDDVDLLKRSMVLAMGAGQPEQAIALAKRVAELETEKSALTELFLAVDDFKAKRYEDANLHIEAMPEGGLTDFIMPMLSGWAKAGVGENNTDELVSNSIHLYHAALINNFLGEEGKVQTLLDQALASPHLMAEDMERIGDIYAHIGNPEKAHDLYASLYAVNPENSSLEQKITMFEDGEHKALFSKINSAEQGFAAALYDMALILAQDYSDESARVFLQMANYLNPALTKGKLLLAVLADRNERKEDAINAYLSVTEDDPAYQEAQRSAADILVDENRKDEALAILNNLARIYNDIESMIQIGDIYRVSEEFPEAITAYNRAEKELGGQIPSEYWHLAYVRGMAYEQNDQWDKAEQDLKLALKYRPSHPYILNYLGYAWADQGKNLDEALNLIEKAVNIEPNDGYIMDSLGWVLYKMEDFKAAVPFLEQAVELMPYDATVNDHLGDAYWRVGRRMEARFQWERAKNHAEDTPELIEPIEDKIVNGLAPLAKDDIKKDMAQDTLKKNRRSAL